METVQFIGTSPKALVNLIDEAVRRQLEDLKKNYQPKEPSEYLSRQETASLLKVDLSTLYNWHKKGILIPKGIGNRVLYERKTVEKAIVELKK